MLITNMANVDKTSNVLWYKPETVNLSHMKKYSCVCISIYYSKQ